MPRGSWEAIRFPPFHRAQSEYSPPTRAGGKPMSTEQLLLPRHSHAPPLDRAVLRLELQLYLFRCDAVLLRLVFEYRVHVHEASESRGETRLVHNLRGLVGSGGGGSVGADDAGACSPAARCSVEGRGERRRPLWADDAKAARQRHGENSVDEGERVMGLTSGSVEAASSLAMLNKS